MMVLKASALATAAAWPSSLARRFELVDQLAGSIELSQMPFRQREEVHRAHLGVIAEPEQRFLVPFADIVAERPLEDGSRRLQVAELERDEADDPARHARLHGAPFGFGFPKEGPGGGVRLAELAAHEAPQAVSVLGDEARGGVVVRSGELAGAGVGRAHFVGGESFQPHRRVTVVGVQLEAPAGKSRVSGRMSGSLPGPLRRRERSPCRDAPSPP